MKGAVILLSLILPAAAFAAGLSGTNAGSASGDAAVFFTSAAATNNAVQAATPENVGELSVSNLSSGLALTLSDPNSPGNYLIDDKHKLMPGDVVSFQIIEDRDKPLVLPVTESAELDIPYIGRLSARGKTCKQLADEVKALLEKDYYYTATVVIGLNAMSKVVGRVYVVGPVRNPGLIEIPSSETFTAGKAILRAGGFGDFADKKDVQIVRKTAQGNTVIKVNLADVFEKGKIESDVPLEDGDFVIVPQRSWNF